MCFHIYKQGHKEKSLKFFYLNMCIRSPYYLSKPGTQHLKYTEESPLNYILGKQEILLYICERLYLLPVIVRIKSGSYNPHKPEAVQISITVVTQFWIPIFVHNIFVPILEILKVHVSKNKKKNDSNGIIKLYAEGK